MNRQQARILVVDDDEQIRHLLRDFLQEEGMGVGLAGDATQMKAQLRKESFDLVILDLMMPGEDGLSALRQMGTDAPAVIMLSAHGTVDDRVLGLELGAEDFIQKPCEPRELLARIRAALRRRRPGPDQAGQAGSGNASEAPRRLLYRFAGWTLDATTRTLFDPQGTVIDLSNREFALLLALVENPRCTLSRDELLEKAQGSESDVFDRAVDVQISRLRRKLAGRAGSLDLIRTVRNRGYVLVPEVERL